MKDFIMSALPWILVGLSVAIAMASISNAKNQTDKNGKKRKEPANFVAAGMGFGMCIGCIAGSIAHNVGLFMGAGMLLGTLIGLMIKKKDKE